LVAVLDPDVVLRADGGAVLAGLPREVRGADAVAGQALTWSQVDDGAALAAPAFAQLRAPEFRSAARPLRTTGNSARSPSRDTRLPQRLW
jgi:hypothetical protein